MIKILKQFRLFIAVALSLLVSDIAADSLKGLHLSYDYRLNIEYKTENHQIQADDVKKVDIDANLELFFYGTDNSTGDRFYVLEMNNLKINRNPTSDKQYPVIFTQSPIIPDTDDFIEENLGIIRNIKIVQSEAEWIANLKRGVLSSLQNNLRQSSSFYPSFESDTAGLNQEYAYSTSQLANGDFQVLKSRNVLIQDGNFGSGRIQVQSQLDSSDYFVKSIQSEDQYQMVLDDLNGLDTKAELKIDLKKKRDFKFEVQCYDFSCFENFISAKYQLPEDSLTQSDLQLVNVPEFQSTAYLTESSFDNNIEVMMGEKLGQVVEIAELVSTNVTKYGSEMLHLIQLLSGDRDLVKVAVSLLQRRDIKSVMIDALIGTGDEETFRQVRDTLAPDYRKDPDAHESIPAMLRALAYVFGHSDMIDFSLKIVETETASLELRTTAALSLGSTIRKIGERRMYRYAWHCLWVLEQFLKKSQTDADKILYLHAIGNAGQQPSIRVIEPFVEDANEDVSFTAVFALRHMTRDSKKILMKAFTNVMLHSEVRILALDLVFIHLDQKEKDLLLKANIDETDGLVQDKVWSMYPNRDRNGSDTATPWIEYSDEIKIIGNQKLSVQLGYLFQAYSPLSRTRPENTVANAETYIDVNAMKKRFNVFKGLFRVQGDLFGKNKKNTEAYLYVSIAGTVWDECIDLLGEACSKRRPDPNREVARCVEKSKQLFAFSAVLFKTGYFIPLIVGIGLKLEQLFVSHASLSTGVAGCSFPFTGDMNLVPTFGLNAVGQASINIFVVRAGARLNMKLLDSALNSRLAADAAKFPIQLCSSVDLHQNKMRGSFELFIQFRRIRWCGKWPCGFPWGQEKVWSKGFDIWREFDKKFVDKCHIIKTPLGLKFRPQLYIQN